MNRKGNHGVKNRPPLRANRGNKSGGGEGEAGRTSALSKASIQNLPDIIKYLWNSISLPAASKHLGNEHKKGTPL